MNDLKTSLKELIDDARLPTPPSMDELRERTGRRGYQAHQPRRLFLGILVALVIISGASLAVTYGPRSGTAVPRSSNRHHQPQIVHRESTTGTLVSTTFSGTFQPTEEVGVGGSLWLINGTSDDGTGCEARRLDARSLEVVASFPLPSCGFNVVAGDNGYLYFEALAGEAGTNNFMIHLESFSTTTGISTVFAPVDLTVGGSGIGHTQLAFIDGWLWLDGSSELVQISPTTGAVAHTITGAPAGASLPRISAGPGGIWLAGDSSPSSVIDLVPFPSTQPQITALPPVAGSQPGSVTIDWMSPVGGQMWLGVTTYTSRPSSPLDRATQQILIVNSSGIVVKRSAVEATGSSLIQVATGLFTVAAPTCSVVQISQVNPSSLSVTTVATLRWPHGPCVNDEDRRVTTAAGGIFVVNEGAPSRLSSMLYRFIPSTATSAGLSITLGGDGLGPVEFGSSKEQATAELTRLLGPASAQGANTGCGPTFTEIDWGELAVEFHGNVFSGYRDINRPQGDLQLGPVDTIEPVQPEAKTAAGIVLGDSLQRLRDAYPKLSLVGANRLQASNGLSFVNNFRSSPGSPESKIIEIRVGTCGDY